MKFSTKSISEILASGLIASACIITGCGSDPAEECLKQAQALTWAGCHTQDTGCSTFINGTVGSGEVYTSCYSNPSEFTGCCTVKVRRWQCYKNGISCGTNSDIPDSADFYAVGFCSGNGSYGTSCTIPTPLPSPSITPGPE